MNNFNNKILNYLRIFCTQMSVFSDLEIERRYTHLLSKNENILFPRKLTLSSGVFSGELCRMIFRVLYSWTFGKILGEVPMKNSWVSLGSSNIKHLPTSHFKSCSYQYLFFTWKQTTTVARVRPSSWSYSSGVLKENFMCGILEELTNEHFISSFLSGSTEGRNTMVRENHPAASLCRKEQVIK